VRRNGRAIQRTGDITERQGDRLTYTQRPTYRHDLREGQVLHRGGLEPVHGQGDAGVAGGDGQVARYGWIVGLEALEHGPAHAVKIGILDHELAALGETAGAGRVDQAESLHPGGVQQWRIKDGKAVPVALCVEGWG
jgi:hypothetical protein